MLIFRDMTLEDVERVAEIEEASFSTPWKKHHFEELLGRTDMLYLVAELDGEVIGGAGLMNLAGDIAITNVEIDSKYRGMGYGSKLIDAVFKRGYEMGGEAFTLEVRTQNEVAVNLYKNKGFTVEGVRKNFYDKPKDDAYIMWKMN